MHKGFIKLFRKVEDNPVVSKDPDRFRVRCHLLLNANHKEKEVCMNGSTVKLKPGQLIVGRKSISEKTGVEESKVYRSLRFLESEQQIEQQKTNRFTVVTIVNWEGYQKIEQTKKNNLNNKGTTDEQQMNTNKNVKNVKNEKNNDITPSKDGETKVYGDPEINKCMDLIKMFNGGVIDGSEKKDRRSAKHLIGKIKKITSVKNGERTRSQYLEGLLGQASKSKYDIRRITSAKNVYDNLASLQQVANQMHKEDSGNLRSYGA